MKQQTLIQAAAFKAGSGYWAGVLNVSKERRKKKKFIKLEYSTYDMLCNKRTFESKWIRVILIIIGIRNSHLGWSRFTL